MTASGETGVLTSIVRAISAAAIGSIVASTLFVFVVDFRALFVIMLGFFVGGLVIAIPAHIKSHLGPSEVLMISLAGGLVGGYLCSVVSDLPKTSTIGFGVILAVVFGIANVLRSRRTESRLPPVIGADNDKTEN